MEEKSTKGPEPSSVVWTALEDWARGKIQDWLQQLLESEVTELLGREKSERRETVDAGAGYRNGFGKRRKLSMTSGTITVRRPRVRGLEERFESRVLPAFKRRTEQVGELLPELSLHSWRLMRSLDLKKEEGKTKDVVVDRDNPTTALWLGCGANNVRVREFVA